MRIIAGKYKGRRINAPDLVPTRPTTDFAKEGLFNILQNQWDLTEVSFLDLFCGTGNISYEMSSRGCTDIISIDLFEGCVKFVSSMIDTLKIEGMQVIKTNVLDFIKTESTQYDLIFAGPPYALEQLRQLPDLIIEHKMLKPKGWFILEHNPNHNFDKHPNFIHKRNYGSTNFSIFSVK